MNDTAAKQAWRLTTCGSRGESANGRSKHIVCIMPRRLGIIRAGGDYWDRRGARKASPAGADVR
jgi:hypothetical protein